MHWTEQRCLACGRAAPAAARARPAIGVPFEACPACAGFVPRPSLHEWELMGPATRLACLAPQLALVLALGLLPALAVAGATLASGGARDPLALLWAAGLGLAFVLGLWLARVASDVRRSRRRLNDPMYRAKLAKFELASQAARNAPAPVQQAGTEQDPQPGTASG